MSKESLHNFYSFDDLAKHLKAKFKHNESEQALSLCDKGDALGAVKLLQSQDLGGKSTDSLAKYGKCYAAAARVMVGRGDYEMGAAYLKKAINLGYTHWHVHHRLELVNRVIRRELENEPKDEWLAQFIFSCDKCDHISPKPLECAKCAKVLSTPVKPVYYNNLNDLYALGVYRWRGDPDHFNPLSRMIRLMKKQEGREVCKYLAYILVEALRQDKDCLDKADMVVSVPADPGRASERGFDNIAELAENMEQYALIPRAISVLEKTRSTTDLRKLSTGSAGERRASLEGSIAMNKQREHFVKGANILLVDDVVTTGATFNLCAEVLKSAGATQVFGAALARSESTQQSDKWSGLKDASD